ncbi:unnamed protein product, partial [Onchocerca flexuosa]|uniref:Ig-like domain-containing protein n=1 Tax=Onchocerca flexuosa TaxID=387005 RepID=A0A183HLK8_9BILA
MRNRLTLSFVDGNLKCELNWGLRSFHCRVPLQREEPPTARVVPRVWNGQYGDKHQFRCITTGSPEPTIVWSGPDGERLPDGVADIGGGI